MRSSFATPPSTGRKNRPRPSGRLPGRGQPCWGAKGAAPGSVPPPSGGLLTWASRIRTTWQRRRCVRRYDPESFLDLRIFPYDLIVTETRADRLQAGKRTTSSIVQILRKIYRRRDDHLPRKAAGAGRGHGCACSAIVTYGHLLNRMRRERTDPVVATGVFPSSLPVKGDHSLDRPCRSHRKLKETEGACNYAFLVGGAICAIGQLFMMV